MWEEGLNYFRRAEYVDHYLLGQAGGAEGETCLVGNSVDSGVVEEVLYFAVGSEETGNFVSKARDGGFGGCVAGEDVESSGLGFEGGKSAGIGGWGADRSDDSVGW